MSSAVNGSSLFVPAYFYPGPLWDKVIHSKPAFVVMNPDNGPGAQPDPNFVKTVAQAQEAGIKILGYIATGYGLENTSKVTEAIFQYDSWYKTDGIFLDQVSSKAEQLEYYQTVADYIRRSNSSSLVAINPGTYPEDMGYMALADMILAFEGSFESYTKIKVPLWTHNFNSSKFVHVVYEVEEIALAHSKVLAAERNAKYAFFTDLKRRDAYTLLPSYFN
ncbi:Spherulation-specific family 4 [Obelidium mucronatum]|nr:Spherulation-specific family 4 [Obelidium mucronatum]